MTAPGTAGRTGRRDRGPPGARRQGQRPGPRFQVLGVHLQPRYRGGQHVKAQVLERLPGVGGGMRAVMHRFSKMAERAARSRSDSTSAISSRTGVVRLISIGVGAHGITISSAYRSADRAMAAWSSICGVSMITTSSSRAMPGRRRCSSRDGRATSRNGNASCGVTRGSRAARSEHSSALPDGSASTSSTLLPDWAKGNTPFAVATKHLQEIPPSLHQINPAIPIAVDGVIQIALAKKREDRFNSAGSMAHALRAIAINPGYLSETQERNAPTIIFPPKVIPPAADKRVDASSGTSISTGLRSDPSSGRFLPGELTQPNTSYPASVNKPQPWLIFIGILLVLILIIGGVLVGLQVNKGTNGTASSTGTITTASTSHPSNPTVGTQSTAISVSTPTAGGTQNPTVYPNIEGTYSGPIYNTYANINSNMTLSINQNQGSINGQFTVALPLQGTGPFTGTIDTSNNIKFIVISKDTTAPILFQGTVNSDGSLSGNYCSVNQANQCDTSVGGHGTWMATRL